MGLFRRKRKRGNPPVITGLSDAAAHDEPPVRSFGYKSAWLAVRAADNTEVAEALNLDQVAASTWAAGIATVREADAGTRPAPVFVGSPVDGWTLVPLSWPLAGAG